MPSTPGKLWLIAAPIGNIDDLSPRAKELLKNADLVLAEDTRRALNLFAQCGLPVKKLLSFFDHNEKERIPAVIDGLKAGQNICLLTDAGTPVLADPGFRLVAECKKENLPVSTAPGPSAAIAALTVSGIPPIPFTFLGFLPRGASAIRNIFKQFAALSTTLVFFERKDRVKETLTLAHEILGDRKFAICRELTKQYEEIITGCLSNSAGTAENLLGELTIVIGPPEKFQKTPEPEVLTLLSSEIAKGVKRREAARAVAANVEGWKAGEIYNLLHIKEEECGD